jgi:hypothetical protein
MISDVIATPCRRCGEHVKRLRAIDGMLARWFLVACVCGTKWVPVTAQQPRPRRRAA